MEAKTLNQIKDEIAIKYGYKDWKYLMLNCPIIFVDEKSNKASELYAKQIALAACEKQREICAESAQMVRTQNLNGEKSFGKKLVSLSDVTTVDKDSILNAPLAITID